VAHRGDAIARDDDGHAQLCSLHDHLAGQPARRVESLVATAHAMQGHPSGDRVDGIVPTHVFDEHQQFGFLRLQTEERAAMHRTRLAVDAVLLAHGFEHAVQCALADAHRVHVGQAHAAELRQHITKHRALAASRGHHAVCGAFGDVGHTLVCAHGCGAHVPIDGDGFDLAHLGDQPLIAQVAQHQQFRAGTQGHQRDDLALVHVDRERPFGRNVDAAAVAVFVQDLDLAQQLATRLGQPRRAGHQRPNAHCRGGKLLAGVFGMQRHHMRRDARATSWALQPPRGQLLAPRP
jgi:hypothetical protein